MEVLVATAILAVSLLALMNFLSQSLLASGRAERIAVSTLLARHKMVGVLLKIEEGIPKGDFPEGVEEEGNFEEEQFSDFFWKLSIKKIEIPSITVSEEQGEIVGAALQMLTDELTRSTREVRLEVGWKEFEEEERGIEVVTHVVNPLGGF